MGEVFEHLNAYRVALNTITLMFVLRYLWLARHSLRRDGVALACSIGLLLLGDDCSRVVMWLVRRAANDGVPFGWSGAAVIIALIGSVLATLAVMWLIRILSPEACRWWGWLIAIGGSAGFVGLMAWI